MKNPKVKLAKVKKSLEKHVDGPVEVIVYDCVNHERIIAEYRNESRWWYGTRMYKVYHPLFTETADSSRWVFKMRRALGPAVPMGEYEQAMRKRDEAAVIAELMR